MLLRRSSSSLSRFLVVATLLLVTTKRAHALVPPALIHTAVGAIAGSTGAIAAYPIDYCKSQLQTEEGRLKYKGGFDVARDIITTSGPFALYRGLMVNVVGIAPEKTIKLSANRLVRAALLGHFGYLPLAGEVVAGGVAGFTQVLVTNPLEVVKLKLQTSQMTVKEVVSQLEGFADLYQGAGACIARDVVFSAVLFPVYAHSNVALAAALMGMGVDSASFWADLLAGSFAAAPAALISTPADVVKTRLQQARSEDVDSETALLGKLIKGDDNHDPHHHAAVQMQFTSPSQLTMSTSPMKDEASFFVVMSSMAQDEGVEVLFSGWFERVVRSVPQFGVTLAMFDLLNTYAVNHGWLLEQAVH